MVKEIVLAILVILSFQLPAYGCKCVMPGPEIDEAYKEANAVFIGQCVKAEFIVQEDADIERTYVVRYTFNIQRTWKGVLTRKSVTVDTGMGFGDCGFQFNLGLSYIVYGHIDDGQMRTNICTRTRIAGFYPNRIGEEAQNEIKNLDGLVKK